MYLKNKILVCRIWKFCPYTNKEPTIEQLKYLEYVHKLRFFMDQKISVLIKNLEAEANIIESEYDRYFKSTLVEENQKKQKEKYFNDIFHLFYIRDN